ncbi:hypothetical protein [Paraglaciecola sp. L3A3]|uniref:hypothetical protein n=1 Tax=Paraglaciecola sp. L3A3 TaxID=2686358 RepID=UPI00131AE2E3|nr:hypothetical protein [Paraglaciecola sp. L3A3]
MKSLLVIVIVCAFMMNCLLFLVACQNADSDTVKHSVSFNHKGNKSKKPIQASLYEGKNSQGETEFYMDVNSVFCGENVCKLDKVRIFWDELGVYQKFELADNIRLEKGNAEDFEQQDYIKLDGILRNPSSGLAELYPAELVNQNRGGNVVDALSGATVSIHNEDTVKGAIWTCYTLWHYANGELSQVIRDISGKQHSLTELTAALLTHTDLTYQIFALEQLTRIGFVDDQTRAVITGGELLHQVALYPNIMNYIEALPKHQYQESLCLVFCIKRIPHWHLLP